MNCTSWTGGAQRTSRAAPRSVSPLRRLGTGGLAVVLAASLYGCSAGGTESSSTSAASARSSASGGSEAEPDPGAEQGGSSPADRGQDEAPGAADETPGAVHIVPPAEPGQPAVVAGSGTGEEKRATTETVALDEPVRPAEGLEITVESAKPVQAEGMGPGGVAGPAIAVVVTVRNTTDSPVATLGSSVTVTYGPDDRPASPSRQPDDVSLPREVAPGKTVSGTYTFLVPEDQREDVVITASYRATDPAAVFAGQALGDGADR